MAAAIPRDAENDADGPVVFVNSKPELLCTRSKDEFFALPAAELLLVIPSSGGGEGDEDIISTDKLSKS